MKQKTFSYVNDIPAARVPRVGEKVVLVSYEQEGSASIRWGISYDLDGIGGNLNRQEKRLHGWRGTTNGVSKYAHGVRKVLKVSEYEENGLDFVKLTVGKDLSPEEE